MRLTRLLAALLLLLGGGESKEYASTYTFLADRSECDGQCTWCRHAHHQHLWSGVREKLSAYVHQDGNYSGEENGNIQRMIDWSWSMGTHYSCIIGIISMRMLSYGYSDPLQFNKGTDFDVLDFLDIFNAHTGALDLLTSSWAAILAGGWPVFRELQHVSRKLKDYVGDQKAPMKYPRLQDRENECDKLDTEEDVRYREDLKLALAGKGIMPMGQHLVSLRRGIGCPIGKSVALLSLAMDHNRNLGLYQGSLKDGDNLVYALISAAQDCFSTWTATKLNWSPFWDLLTTEWPIWDLLSEFSCIDTTKPCATRSAWNCYDYLGRREVPCPHRPPKVRKTFAACGEHDVCTWPDKNETSRLTSPEEWCIPFDRRPPSPRAPWLLGIGHDEEDRVCSQCGQDGILREIFKHVGFRDAAGPAAGGGLPPYFVEFGARKPGMLNSAVLRSYCLWEGLLMDGQPGETPHGGCKTCPGVAELVRKEFVTADNIVSLFRKHAVPRDFDLLTVDTDYNDYWLLRALLEDGTFRPRVIAVDFNPDIPIDQAKAVRYEADAEWDGSVYTVASLLAYTLLAHEHGYSFAYALEMGAHSFFVRKDLLAEEDRELPLRSVKKASHLPDELGRAFVDVLYDHVPGLARGAPVPGASGGEASLREEVRELSAQVRALRAFLGDGQGPRPAAAEASPRPGSGASGFYDDVRQRRSR